MLSFSYLLYIIAAKRRNKSPYSHKLNLFIGNLGRIRYSFSLVCSLVLIVTIILTTPPCSGPCHVQTVSTIHTIHTTHYTHYTHYTHTLHTHVRNSSIGIIHISYSQSGLLSCIICIVATNNKLNRCLIICALCN